MERPSLKGFIEWVGKQDPNQTYDYLDVENCAVSQYLKAQQIEPNPYWEFIGLLPLDIPYQHLSGILMTGRTFGNLAKELEVFA